MAESRLLPVPDGLDGLRLDVAISRLLGFSRTAAADLIDGGHVSLDGAAPPRSAKVHGGALLEVRLPEPARPVADTRPVDGLAVLYEDDDVVVVDKPVGVAAHPSPGWTGPTVIGGLAATGFRIATSGAAERQGVVHRLDVGTTGVMVVAKSEHAYTVLKAAFKQRTVDKRYAALVQGHPDPTSGTIDAPIGRHPAVRHPCVGDLAYGADPVLAARLGLSRQWLHARSLGFEHPSGGAWVEVTAPFPADLQHALDVLRDES